MKNRYFAIMTGLLAVAMTACSDDDVKVDPVEPVNPGVNGAEVTISTASIQTKKATLEFQTNDKMTVFAKSGRLATSDNIVDGVVATNNGTDWTLEPKVILDENQTTAYIYAVSPADAEYTDLKKIPVDLSKQVDLMYSGSFVAASKTSPSVKLTMKHALSLLSFNIAAVNYSGAGTLNSLAVNGDIFYTSGSMDATSGDITNLGGAGKMVNKEFGIAVAPEGFKSNIPGLWALPFNTKTGDVTLTAVVDGKEYTAILPEVEVKQGWQYIFRLALTNNGLEFDPTKTETISLNVVTDNDVKFNDYGSIEITASGSSVTTPQLEGDGVFGTLTTPTKSSSYGGATTVDGLSNGQKVIVESWNSTGFTISSLENISSIDISGYE